MALVAAILVVALIPLTSAQDYICDDAIGKNKAVCECEEGVCYFRLVNNCKRLLHITGLLHVVQEVEYSSLITMATLFQQEKIMKADLAMI